jgi:hypothetical protein
LKFTHRSEPVVLREGLLFADFSKGTIFFFAMRVNEILTVLLRLTTLLILPALLPWQSVGFEGNRLQKRLAGSYFATFSDQ